MPWEKISGFTSPGEYARFVVYIEQQVANSVVQELPADAPSWQGHDVWRTLVWDVETDGVRRLVQPDPPFLGLWEPMPLDRSN